MLSKLRSVLFFALFLGIGLVSPSHGLIWDPDLDGLGVTLTPASPSPGQTYWELIEAYADDPEEGAGRINIFFKCQDVSGYFQPNIWVRTAWNSGYSDVATKYPPDWGDFPMSGGNWCPPDPPGPYTTFVLGRNAASPDPSDRVVGMGLPCNLHYSYRLIFHERIAVGEPTDTPLPPVTPTPTGCNPTGPPRWVLTYARQIGYHMNHNPLGNHVHEAHCFHSHGQHAVGVGLTNRYNPGTAIFGQTDWSGHLRTSLNPPTNPYDFHVFDLSVASDETPDYHWYVPPNGYSGHYSFESHWMRVNHDDEVVTYPFNPVYHYDLCSGFNDEVLNHPAGFESDAASLTTWSGYQAQTFVVPQGINRIIAVKGMVTRGFDQYGPRKCTWRATIREGGPSGTQVGPAITAREISADEFFPVLEVWGLNDVPVVSGQTYAVRFDATDGLGFNAYGTNNNNYPYGQMYNGPNPVSGKDMVAVVIGCYVPCSGPGPGPTNTFTPQPTPTPGGCGLANADFESWSSDQNAEGWLEFPDANGGVDRGQSEVGYGDNYLVPGSLENVRVGAGWRAYSLGLAQRVSVLPGVTYRLSGYGRFLHGTDLANMYVGVNVQNQTMEMGYDLTGQTSALNAPTIQYTDMTANGNNMWARYETTFTASGSSASVWLHASQPTSEVGLCHYDDFCLEPIGGPTPTNTPTRTPTEEATVPPTHTLPPLPTELQNPSFDENPDGTVASHWESWTFDGSPSFLQETGFWRHTASGKSQRWWSNGGTYDAGLYQTVGAVPGTTYQFCCWLHHYDAGGAGQTSYYVGIDPNGGTDPNAAVWCAPVDFSGEWEQLCVNVTATGNRITVFCRVDANPQSLGERSSFADDASLLAIVTPTATPTLTPPLNDRDVDGIADDSEGGKAPAAGQSNGYLPDSDGDGLMDGTEDTNRNGAQDPGETSTRDFDSDGDDYEDGIEVLLLSSDPLSPGSPSDPYSDADADALPDNLDPNDGARDTDGDRFADGYEAACLGLSAVTDETAKPGLGDVDSNTVWDNADAQLILNFFASIPGPVDFTRTDVKREGIIDNADAQLSLNFFARHLDALPSD